MPRKYISPIPKETTAYKGYLIKNSRNGTWIEKDGYLIAWTKDIPEAKREIDELTRYNDNPTLAVLGPLNPAHIFGEVKCVKYRHKTEGYREHNFGTGTKIEALPDGSVRIFHPSKRVWLEQ